MGKQLIDFKKEVELVCNALLAVENSTGYILVEVVSELLIAKIIALIEFQKKQKIDLENT